MKRCPKCEQILDDSKFHKNRKYADGLDWRCIECKKKTINRHRRREREKKYYDENHNGCADKMKARDHARRIYGNAEYPCAVANCSLMSDDLHHIDYSMSLDVIPLCKEHHKLWHDTWAER